MTTWSWTCRACGYEFQNPIFRFIPECPKCNVKYVKLATANGAASIGILPIYAIQGQAIDNPQTKNSVQFGIAIKSKYFECYSKEFYEFLKKEFSDDFAKKNIDLKLKEKDEGLLI